MAAPKHFAWYDYLLFVITLAISLGIGVFYACTGGKQRSTSEYLLADRRLHPVAVSLSMFMSYISAILVLGASAEMYTFGVQMWLQAAGTVIAIVISALTFVPLFYPLKVTSVMEYLYKRFRSKAVLLTGDFLLITSQVIYMGIAMYAPASALQASTGIPMWASIIALGVVATIYTTIGGMKAVIWTDVFQSLVMLIGLVVIIAIGAHKVGGIGSVWAIASRDRRVGVINFDTTPLLRMSFWSVIFGRVLASLYVNGVSQTSVQRYCSVPSIRQAYLAVFLNIPLILLIYALTCLSGLIVYAFYANLGCDPLRTKLLRSSNQVLPFFLVNDVGAPGLPGLFVAVLFSGALSTLSSSINSMAAVTWRDLLAWKFDYLPEVRKALISKVIAVLFGLLSCGLAFLAMGMGGHVLQAAQSFVSGVAGPLLGLFMLGAYFPCANWIGAVVGAWSGLAMTLTCSIGSYIHKPYRATLPSLVHNCTAIDWTPLKPLRTDPEGINPMFRVSFMWFAGIGTITCVVVGLLVSFLTCCDKEGTKNPSYFIPYFDRVLCCLPRRWLSRCWCGIHHEAVRLDKNGHLIEEAVENNVVKKEVHDDSINLTDTDRPPSYSNVSRRTGDSFNILQPSRRIVPVSDSITLQQQSTLITSTRV